MSYEDERLESAISCLKETQKLCHAAEEESFFSFRKRFAKKVAKVVWSLFKCYLHGAFLNC